MGSKSYQSSLFFTVHLMGIHLYDRHYTWKNIIYRRGRVSDDYLRDSLIGDSSSTAAVKGPI